MLLMAARDRLDTRLAFHFELLDIAPSFGRL